jgi:hypothetical protein
MANGGQTRKAPTTVEGLEKRLTRAEKALALERELLDFFREVAKERKKAIVHLEGEMAGLRALVQNMIDDMLARGEEGDLRGARAATLMARGFKVDRTRTSG